MSTKILQNSTQTKRILNSKGSATQIHPKGAARNRGVAGSCGFVVCRRPDLWPVRLIKNLGGKVANGVRLVSVKIRPSPSPQVSSSGRSTQLATPPVDAHRSEAIKDCIEFINSSSSFPRSNSKSVNPH